MRDLGPRRQSMRRPSRAKRATRSVRPIRNELRKLWQGRPIVLLAPLNAGRLNRRHRSVLRVGQPKLQRRHGDPRQDRSVRTEVHFDPHDPPSDKRRGHFWRFERGRIADKNPAEPSPGRRAVRPGAQSAAGCGDLSRELFPKRLSDRLFRLRQILLTRPVDGERRSGSGRVHKAV
jgi:hypothetical protein